MCLHCKPSEVSPETTLGPVVRIIRVELGMCVHGFAKAMYVGPRTVNRWQKGTHGMRGHHRARLLNLTSKLGTPAVAQLRNIFARDGIIAMERP